MAPEELAAIRAPHDVPLVGLMTIAPMGATLDEARAVFRRLRELRDELQERIGTELPELSMGMTADAEAAAAEGATLVRIGTALFGPEGGRWYPRRHDRPSSSTSSSCSRCSCGSC
jgi:PLP dependent protein